MSERLRSLITRARATVDRLLAVRIIENSVVLAAQEFLALFPLLILAYAVLPSEAARGLLDSLHSHLGISGQSGNAVQSLLTDRQELQQSLSVFGVIVVLGSATAFTRALQRVFESAWDLPKLGLRGAWRGFAWLLGVVMYIGIIGWLGHVINGDTSTLTSVLTGFLLWWWTAYLLLGGRVRWRSLWPGAILTAIGQAVVTFASVIVMPRIIRSNESNFGPIGVVFAVESWLIVISAVVVAGAALGAAIGRDSGRIGQWVRGSPAEDSWRRTPPTVS